MVKEEVVEIVEESRQKKEVLKAFNATFLSLIPKETGADRPDKFRPIALCNVVYKNISKVIANRLKTLLPSLICPKQSGFVEGCQILDGVILIHEFLHSLQILRQPGMLIKLDITKAYDNLSWKFICRMLEAYGFCHDWVEWVMGLILTPFFSILLNGASTHPFQSSRGIRKGDPLSPFIFILMTEGLSCLLCTKV